MATSNLDRSVTCTLCGTATDICAHCQSCADGTLTGDRAGCAECDYWAERVTFDDLVRGIGELPLTADPQDQAKLGELVAHALCWPGRVSQ